MTDLTELDADEILAYALNLAGKGVQIDDGHQYLVHAHDLVDYAETLRALVADHKALRHMHNELRSVCNTHIAELEAEVTRLTKPPTEYSEDAKAAAREAREDIRARFPHMHERDENNVIRVPDLTRYSNAYLRRLADEAERIITERVNDGAFS